MEKWKEQTFRGEEEETSLPLSSSCSAVPVTLSMKWGNDNEGLEEHWMGLRLAQEGGTGLGSLEYLRDIPGAKKHCFEQQMCRSGTNICSGGQDTTTIPALEVQQHRHRKSSQSTCWNYSKLKSQPHHHFPLFLLCYSLVGFWEFIFYNPKPAWVFSLTFSASNTVRSSQSTCWTGFKYLLHSVIVAINLYLLFSSCTTQCLVYYAALTVSHSFHLLSYKTLG